MSGQDGAERRRYNGTEKCDIKPLTLLTFLIFRQMTLPGGKKPTRVQKEQMNGDKLFIYHVLRAETFQIHLPSASTFTIAFPSPPEMQTRPFTPEAQHESVHMLTTFQWWCGPDSVELQIPDTLV